jgi:asparagine synthase (glutamine-hydrolysing)
MCGLAGIVDLKASRDFDPGTLKRMTDLIAHRGPDGDGFHFDHGIALGHRRLAIIDLNTGDQPMYSPDGDIVVVFNGEIYNFREVRAELESSGHIFRTSSDTEVLIHGWRQWGWRVVERLRGMFALALWDRRSRTLFLARDRLGEKPMHYVHLTDGTLAFASEIKAFNPLSGWSRALNPEAIEDFFALGYVPDPKTIYAQVQKLPPGCVLIASSGGEPKVIRYWDLLEGGVAPPERESGPEELHSRLEEAVRAQMVADVEVGAFLSGGVDSSTVVALMTGCSRTPVRSFSIGFKEAAFDESAHAQAVAQRYRTRHVARQVSAGDVSLIDRLAEIYDEPFGDQSAIPTFVVCRLARENVKVCLSGDGGDEALAGYRRYRFFLKQQRLRSVFPLAVRSPLFGTAAKFYPKLDRAPQWMRAKTTLSELAVDDAEAFYRMNCAMPDGVRHRLFGGDFQNSLHGYHGSNVIRQAYEACKGGTALQRAQYVDLTTYLPGDILVKVDRAAMANSLEVRPPLLDPGFVRWCFGVASHQKIRNNHGKALLRDVASALLPPEVLHRPKMGFSMPVSAWMRNELRERMQELVHGKTMRESGYFDMRVVQELWNEHISRSRDHARPLWLLLAFANFLELRQSQSHGASQFAAV